MRLQQAADSDFDWLDGRAEPPNRLTVAPDLTPPGVLAIVRTMPANWLIIVADEVVGMIGIKAEATDRRSVEIGYGTAASRQRMGYARHAVRLLIEELRPAGLTAITAETSVDNPASQRVLQANGFREHGRRIDEEDGPLICWTRPMVDALRPA